MNNRYHQTDAQEKLKTDFQTKLDAILGRTLTARNINAYADDALNDLVVLVEEIVAGTRYIFPLSDIENERRALADASLDPDTIDQTLNHIANVAESTHHLDELIIKKAKFTDTVLVPPDAAKVAPIVAGDGSFEKPKECIPKLKTLLLLLETEFGIDLENDTELPPILEGPIDPGMVRSTTYKLVNIPSLNRLILVCDEVGNTTFVFNQLKCKELGIEPSELLTYGKDKLKQLVGEEGLGRSIRYTSQYVNHLFAALMADSVHKNNETQEFSLLAASAPVAPEGTMTRNQFLREYHIQHPDLKQWITELYGSEEHLPYYRFGNDRRCNVHRGLSEEMQQQILEHARMQHGVVEFHPEGYISAKGISHITGSDQQTIERYIKKLDELGKLEEEKMYRFGSVTTRGFSPHDVEKIKNQMESKGLLLPAPPKGYMSHRVMARNFGVSPQTIRKVVTELQDALGEVKLYKIGSNVAVAYSPEQQRMVLDYVKQQTKIKLGEAALEFIAAVD